MDVMKKIVFYVCSILISIFVLTSCDSKPSNTPDPTASLDTVDSSLREKKSADSMTENYPAESDVSLESGFSSESAISTEIASIPEKKVFSLNNSPIIR